MQKINDDYHVIGTDMEGFKKAVKEMKDITNVSKFPLTSKYTFLSVLSVDKEQIIVVVLNGAFISLFQSGAFFTMNCNEQTQKEKWSFIKTINKKYFLNNFFEENIKTNDLLILNEKNSVVLVSDDAYATMLQRLNLSCEGMLDKSLGRNVMIAEKMYHYQDVVNTIVTRSNEKGYEKLMAVMSEKYTYIPQTLLIEVIEELERGDALSCLDFKVDNRTSYINLRFKDKEQEVKDVYKIDKAIPGIYLATSDTGDCSITAKAFFQFGNSRATIGEVTRRHEGPIDKIEMLDNIRKTLFPLYTIIPDKLIALMAIDIIDPIKGLKAALRHVELVKLIGKKNEMAISEQLISEISPTMRYTGYDIVMMCLQIAERIQDISGEAKRKLEKGIIKVIDTDFSKLVARPIIASLAD